MKGDLSPFGFNFSKLLVLNNIKKELGMDQIEHLYYGAAPMKQRTKDFFATLNMPVVSLYGLSETSGGCTIQEFPYASLTNAGIPFPGTSFKIFNPNEKGVGEICIKGRNVFMGYLKMEKVTWQAFDSEGYFHTGDSGYLDTDGQLVLAGRIKELIITSGGENVTPGPIELAMKESCPLVSHAFVVGEQKKYLTFLLSLKVSYHESTNVPTKYLSIEAQNFIKIKLGLKIKTVEEAKKNEIVLKYIQRCVNRVNERAVNRVHTIKKWVILDTDFSTDGGELTPTLKIKRNVISKKYAE